MKLERETIGKFIDASVNNHAEAEGLLAAHPELKQANWMGEEEALTNNGRQLCLSHLAAS